MSRRLLNYLGLSVLVAQALLVLVSWLLSATMVSGVHSLLSAEGLRWYLGHYSWLLLSPLLSWLLLAAMAWGSLRASGLLSALSHRPTTYRSRLALTVALVVITICLCAVALLSFFPHAVLRSATGLLFPSPFSRALVPMLCMTLMVSATAYGLISGRFHRPDSVFRSFIDGIAASAPLLFIYVVFIQFYESLRFVFF